jgi:hypothetical protein
MYVFPFFYYFRVVEDDHEGLPEDDIPEPGTERDPRYILGRKLLGNI